jgi:hypothetical protein
LRDSHDDHAVLAALLERAAGMRAEQRRGLAFAMLSHLKRVAMDAQANGQF